MQSEHKKHIKTIVIAAVIAAALAAAFFFTGSPSRNSKGDVQNSVSLSLTVNESRADISEAAAAQPDIPPSQKPDEPSRKHVSIPAENVSEQSFIQSEQSSEDSFVQSLPDESSESIESAAVSEQNSDLQDSVIEAEVSSSVSVTESKLPEASPEPSAEPVSEQDAEEYCTISINCVTLLDNMSDLKKNKRAIVPSDGVILAGTRIDVYEGDSVFDLTKRLCMELRIPFEFTMTPVYNTAYIEGIYNLYEFDCGSGSGWVYTVNGIKPSVGCSDYPAHSGDVIEWHYTCSLGNDISDIREG